MESTNGFECLRKMTRQHAIHSRWSNGHETKGIAVGRVEFPNPESAFLHSTDGRERAFEELEYSIQASRSHREEFTVESGSKYPPLRDTSSTLYW